MKKKLSVLLATVLLISTIWVPGKVEASCSCNAGKYLDDTRISAFYPTSYGTHYNYWIYDLKCNNCGAPSIEIGDRFQEFSHNWGSWLDSGHIGSSQHRQIRYCTVNCGASSTQTYSCSGNPCRLPY